jgi:hypothetical protein
LENSKINKGWIGLKEKEASLIKNSTCYLKKVTRLANQNVFFEARQLMKKAAMTKFYGTEKTFGKKTHHQISGDTFQRTFPEHACCCEGIRV